MIYALLVLTGLVIAFMLGMEYAEYRRRPSRMILSDADKLALTGNLNPRQTVAWPSFRLYGHPLHPRPLAYQPSDGVETITLELTA